MCDCIKKIEKKILKQEFKYKKVIAARFISGALMFSTGKVHSCSEVEIQIEGQKKKGIQKVIHTYCPFCGVKYPEIK
jgi:hypothetical protein